MKPPKELKVARTSYSLEDEYQELFRNICRRTRRGMTEELRLMLDARAQTLGMTPLNPVDPKSLAPLREMTPV